MKPWFILGMIVIFYVSRGRTYIKLKTVRPVCHAKLPESRVWVDPHRLPEEAFIAT